MHKRGWVIALLTEHLKVNYSGWMLFTICTRQSGKKYSRFVVQTEEILHVKELLFEGTKVQ